MEKDARTLLKRHAFGARSDVRGALEWLDEGTLMFPVGKCIALHNISSNNQRFLEASCLSSSITALAVSANKKFVAIAEGGDSPQVQIVDTVTRKRRKVLSVGDLNSDRFVALGFSSDGRHLVTQGGPPGWGLYYWNWERSKPLAHIPIGASLEDVSGGTHGTAADRQSGNEKTPPPPGSGGLLGGAVAVTEVSVCPGDALIITVSGVGFLRYYQYNGALLQSLPSCGIPQEQQEAFLTQCWVTPNTLIASTRRGGLVHIRDGKYVGMLTMPSLSSTSYSSRLQAVTAITPMRSGFVTATDQGDICVYEVQLEPSSTDTYALVCTQKMPDLEKRKIVNFGGRTNSFAAPSKSTASANVPSEAETVTEPASRRPKFTVSLTDDTSSEAVHPAGDAVSAGTRTSLITAPPGDTGRMEAVSATDPLGRHVSSIALDQSEERLAIMTQTGRLYALDFRQDWARVHREGRELDIETMCQPFHTGRVNGMDCSVRKPFLITTSNDRSVCIWNTSTRKLEFAEFFQQVPGAVAIHPSGLMAVVCFVDKVRVMNILWNSLKDRTVINFRNSTAVKFSHGGQYFAIAHGNLVDVFTSTTCAPHGQFRGHPQRVRDLVWCATTPYPTDNRLVTCSSDGMLMDWNTVDMKKEVEHCDKRFLYSAVASDDRNVWVVAEPTPATALEAQWRVTLRELDRHSMGSQNASSDDYEFTDATLTHLCVAPHQRILFAGTENGSLKAMPLPLQAGIQDAPITAHGAEITCMALAFDETSFFTGGSDGSIFVWDIREDGRKTQDARVVTDEVLVTQQELEDSKLEVESLQQQIERIKTEIDSEEKRRNHEQGTRVRERAEEFKSDAATLAAEYATLWNAKSEQERSFVAIKLEKEAEAAQKLEELERARQSEVQELEGLCEKLQFTLDQEQLEHASSLRELALSIQREHAADAEHCNEVLTQRQGSLEKLRNKLERFRQTNEEATRQLELDIDVESEAVATTHQKEVKALRERFLRMKGEGAIMQKNALRTEREIEVRSGEMRLLDSAKTALTGQLTDLNLRMTQLHQDIDERDTVIGEKERSIYSLKKQNQELEKHKFVLDHRIRQLKAQMEPKQREITQHNGQIKQKNNELQRLHAHNLMLRDNIEELKADLALQQQHTKHLLSRIKDFETYKIRFQKDVGELAAALQEPARLRDTLEGLHQKHFKTRGGHRTAAADPLIKQEFQSQLEYLSTSVGALRRKVNADQQRHKTEVSQMMVENLAMIREIHDLRSEINVQRSVLATEEANRRSRGASRRTHTNESSAATSVSLEARSAVTSSGVTHTVASTGAPYNSQSSVGSCAVGRGASGRRLGSKKVPEPPAVIAENRDEIRMMRAYINAMERSLAAVLRPTSGPRLPPLS